MKALVALICAGLLGALAASLAAQPPREDRTAGPPRGVLYEGPVEVVVGTEGEIVDTLRGNGRVYGDWVVIDDVRQMIPREMVRRIVIRESGRFDEFGDTPGVDPNQEPDRSPDDPPKRRPFRED